MATLRREDAGGQDGVEDIRYSVLITRAVEDGKALWPEECDMDFLTQMRAQNPVAFAMQYQNDVSLADESVFKSKNIRRWQKLPDELMKYIAIDPAISLRTSADSTAIICIGVDVTGDVYVIEYFKGKVLPEEAIATCVKMYERQSPMLLAVETVQFQRMLYYELRRRRIYGGGYMNVVGVRPDADKIRRILTLHPLYSQRKVFHPLNSPELDEELLGFKQVRDTRSSVDDLLDAFALAVKCIYWRNTNELVGLESESRQSRYCGAV